MTPDDHRAEVEKFFATPTPHFISGDKSDLREALYAHDELGAWCDSVDSVSPEQAIMCWAIVKKLRTSKFPPELSLYPTFRFIHEWGDDSHRRRASASKMRNHDVKVPREIQDNLASKNFVDRVIAITAEWSRSCTCADVDAPWECKTCTINMVRAVKRAFSECTYTFEGVQDTSLKLPSEDGRRIIELREALVFKTPEQRIDIFDEISSGYCKYCGEARQPCHCMNDD